MFKFIRPEQITEYIKDGDTVAINAFLALANPDKLQDAMAESFIKMGHPTIWNSLPPPAAAAGILTASSTAAPVWA